MAIAKLVTLPNGKMLNYHHIERVRLFNGTCEVTLASYISAAQRGKAVEPEFRQPYRIPYDLIQPHLTEPDFDVRTVAYAHIKSLATWKGVKDVIDKPVDLESIPGTPGPTDGVALPELKPAEPVFPPAGQEDIPHGQTEEPTEPATEEPTEE